MRARIASWRALVRNRSHTALAYMHVGFFTCFRHISGTQSFQESRLFDFHVYVALKVLVLLIGRFIACSARMSVERQTDISTVTLAVLVRRGLISTTDYFYKFES